MVKPQMKSYNACYESYKHKYHWMAFLDIDEYLNIGEFDTVDEYLNDAKREGQDCLVYRWKNYGDNDLLYYDKRPVYERFTKEVDLYDIEIKYVVKFFIRCETSFTINFHDPCFFSYFAKDTKKFNMLYEDKDKYFLQHYKYLTISEYLTRRLGRRGYACDDPYDVKLVIDMFFKANERTPQKEKIIEEFLKLY